MRYDCHRHSVCVCQTLCTVNQFWDKGPIQPQISWSYSDIDSSSESVSEMIRHLEWNKGDADTLPASTSCTKFRVTWLECVLLNYSHPWEKYQIVPPKQVCSRLYLDSLFPETLQIETYSQRGWWPTHPKKPWWVWVGGQVSLLSEEYLYLSAMASLQSQAW